jgi:hypothetical protein
MDDFKNKCGKGSWPLMKAIAKGLAKEWFFKLFHDDLNFDPWNCKCLIFY